jgi:transposase/DNA-binding transcriptional regulator YhcF (GntR family)
MTHLAGHDAHLAPRQREDIIHRVLDEGEGVRQTAREVGVNPSTVSRTVQRFLTTGDIHEHVSGGHSTAYDDDDLYRLDCLIDQHPSATIESLHELMGSAAPIVTSATISAYRLVLGYTRRRPAIWEIDSERTQRLRQAWVAEHKAADHTRWVFMDESTLCLRDTGEYVWVKRGQPTPKHEIAKLRCHVNVWGAVWNDGSVFAFYTGHLTGKAYAYILDTSLSPHIPHLRRRTFLHDGSTAHRTAEVTAWADEHKLDMLVLPPHSPQFNAIEEVWSWIKHDVKRSAPLDHSSLQTACKSAWESIGQAKIKAFIDHAHAVIVGS